MPELPDRIPGEIILASYNNDQRDRLVERYVDATARSVATPLPVAGTVSYLTSTGIFAIFDGANWVDFVDTRGGQTIEGSLVLDDFLHVKRASNQITIFDALNEPFQFQATAGVMSLSRDLIPMILENTFTWSIKSDWNLDPAARIINDPDNVPSTRATFRFGVGASAVIESQLYAIANGRMVLDADQVVVSLPNTTTLDNRIVRPSITTGVSNPVGSDHYELMRFTGSSEEYKDINTAAMTKAHGHHPVHLLDVEFKRWSYKADYLVDGDPRAGGDWWAPTAETMDAAYPWAVDPAEDGSPGDINTKVLVEGLLWHIQDLTSRLTALEAKVEATP